MVGTLTITIVFDCLFPFTRGGGERQYRAFAEAAVARGVQVEYLTARQWDGSAPSLEGIDVTAVTPRLRMYDERGVRRIPAALRFAWGVLRELRRRRGTSGAVLVSALPIFNVFAARLALLGTRTRIAADYLEVWGLQQWREYAGPVTGTVAWLLQRAAIASTPVATCHSALSAARLREEGFRGELLVSPGLIDPAFLDGGLAESAAVPPYVVFAGRHIPDKRVAALPAAVAHARRTIPGLQLVVLGDGPSGSDVRAAVHSVGGHDWTRIPGFVDEEDLRRLMAGAACLVNPSRREGYGLVVVEAAASGTPVVLVEDPGNAATELITAGVNGFVAPDASPSALGDAIVRAVQGGEPLRQRTRAWYDDALRTRTITITMDRILDALEVTG